MTKFCKKIHGKKTSAEFCSENKCPAGSEKTDFNQDERNIKIFLAIRKVHGEFMIPQNKEIRNAQKRSSLRKGNPPFQKTENPCFKETRPRTS